MALTWREFIDSGDSEAWRQWLKGLPPEETRVEVEAYRFLAAVSLVLKRILELYPEVLEDDRIKALLNTPIVETIRAQKEKATKGGA